MIEKLARTEMKKSIKNLMYRIVPRYATRIFSIRARRHAHEVYRNWGCPSLNYKIVRKLGSRVATGPFKGLELTPETLQEHAAPYLLGVYESELHTVWALAFRQSYEQILDIGCKFGFYACGLALKFSNVPVIAFDTDPWAQAATRDMADANGVADQVTIESYCDKNWLGRRLRPNSLIVCDCEGYEATLFTGSGCENLRTATLIVETHDHEVANATELVKQSLAKTHAITVIDSFFERTEPSLDLSFLEPRERTLALSDVRPRQHWLFAVPSVTDSSIAL